MPNGIHAVAPGQVISSDLFNQVLQRLGDLEERVAQIENGASLVNRVYIERFEPPVQQETGRVLEIIGRNFLYPPGRNLVRVGATAITAFLGSSTTSLRFNIPELPGVPNNFSVSVANDQFGTFSRSYRVVQGTQPPGESPSIDPGGVTHEESGGSTLVVGEPIVITGANFAAEPAQNRITLVPRASGGVSHEVTNIDTDRSDESNIFATLPGFSIISPLGVDQYTLRLEVGASAPAEVLVSITT
jgi:hypothetical protein